MKKWLEVFRLLLNYKPVFVLVDSEHQSFSRGDMVRVADISYDLSSLEKKGNERVQYVLLAVKVR